MEKSKIDNSQKSLYYNLFGNIMIFLFGVVAFFGFIIFGFVNFDVWGGIIGFFIGIFCAKRAFNSLNMGLGIIDTLWVIFFLILIFGGLIWIIFDVYKGGWEELFGLLFILLFFLVIGGVNYFMHRK